MKALVIGYGSIGKRHVGLLRDDLGLDVAVVTKQSVPDLPTFRSLESVTQIDSFDYFVIASETHLHRNQLLELEKRVAKKHILVEKPIFDSVEPRLNGTLRNSVYVAYNLRFHPLIQRLKAELKDQSCLHVNIITGQYLPSWRPDRDYRETYSAHSERGGGVLLDLSHEIDYAQWLFGKIKHVNAYSEKISNLEISSDDFCTLIAKTETGVYVSITLDCISKIPMKHISVHTAEKSYCGDLLSNTLKVGDRDMSQDTLLSESIERNVSFLSMHKALLSEKPRDLCSYEEAVSVLELIYQIKAGCKE